ncbi:MAG: ABC transporter ATP-binding protein [Spirochaetales bacterium]|nr:ABC transporter ATP-binding protein [Spirochaetales bacterium]
MLSTLKMIAGRQPVKLARMALISTMEALFGAVPFGVLYFLLCRIMDNTFSRHSFFLFLWILLASALLRIFFSFLNVTVTRKDGTLMVKDLRLRLGEHIRKLSLGFFNTHDVGELSNRVLSNVNQVELIITMLLPETVSTLILSLFVGAGLFFIDPRMALATIITMPLALLILIWARGIMDKQGAALLHSTEQLANGIIEFVNGIKFLKSFNNSSRKYDALVHRMDDFRDKSLKTEGRLSPVMVLSGIAIDFGLVMLLLTGSFLLAGGSLSGKTMLIFIIISSRFFENLKTLSMNYVKVKYLTIAGDAIQGILDEKLQGGAGHIEDFLDHNIRFEDVSFSYKETAVLKNINLEIKENTLTALVGPSGSGKTTMANLIARFFDVDSGVLWMGGQDLSRIDPEAVNAEMSMVFQNVSLFNDTIYNNIKIGKYNATREEIIEAAKRANCHEFIMNLPDGYETMVGENGCNLSGGEQQRISIARAILKDAPVILLDEATASLDPENEIFIQNAISELLKNKTIIVIAHRLKTIKEADKIVVLDEGEIREEGSHEELLDRRGLYYQLWETQQRAVGWQVENRSNL